MNRLSTNNYSNFGLNNQWYLLTKPSTKPIFCRFDKYQPKCPRDCADISAESTTWDNKKMELKAAKNMSDKILNCLTAFCLLTVIGTSALTAQLSPKSITPDRIITGPVTSKKITAKTITSIVTIAPKTFDSETKTGATKTITSETIASEIITPEPNDTKTITPESNDNEPNDQSVVLAPELTPESNDNEPNDQSVVLAPELTPEQITALDSPPANTPSENLTPTTNVWQKIYHPSVDERVYIILRYPYYPGGKPYSSNDQLITEPTTNQLPTAEPNSSTIPSNQNIASDDTSNPQSRINNLLFNTEQCVAAIHQWREINESPGTALEIIHAIELSRRKSGIYQIQPKLAVNVIRTLGKIGQVNYQFDYISRLILQKLLAGYIDRPLLIRMDKKLSELKSLTDLLTNQNDQVGIALGIGKINRQAYLTANQKSINYTSLTHVPIP